MKQQLYPELSKPSERVPAGRLVVPVRPGPAGLTVRVFRTPLGDRTAVAFSGVPRLVAVLGPDQPWVVLAEPAVRALFAPLGVTALTVDPQLAAPAPQPWPARADLALPRERSRAA
ncbi:SAV_915 family protein [Kitasatospora sp. NPDC059795]|uniref:SAV_915 family protein n=1 Tax=Kitasatospora sp. NPDC059795 TaxID=3346949 RepID=UPI003653E5CC